MHFVTIKDKNLIINNDVFKYTDQIKIMHNKKVICIFSSKNSGSVYYDVSKGQVLEIYFKTKDDWLYYETLVYSYVTMRVSQNQVEKILFDRKNLIKEILGYGTNIW